MAQKPKISGELSQCDVFGEIGKSKKIRERKMEFEKKDKSFK